MERKVFSLHARMAIARILLGEADLEELRVWASVTQAMAPEGGIYNVDSEHSMREYLAARCDDHTISVLAGLYIEGREEEEPAGEVETGNKRPAILDDGASMMERLITERGNMN